MARVKFPPHKKAQQKRVAKRRLPVKHLQKCKPVIKKAFRYRPGTVALREIRRFQRTTRLLIPKASFQRVARKVAQDNPDTRNYRWQPKALLALHEAAEDYMVRFFEDAQLCSIHAKRVTVLKRDMKLAGRIRGDDRM